MKKLLLVCAFVVGVSSLSFAQGGGGQGAGGGQGGGRRGGGTPEQQIERLKTQITGITDDQVAKLKVIYTEAGKKRDSLMTAATAAGGDRTAMMATFTKLNAANDAKIKAVLTAEQGKVYQKQIDERAERMKAMQNGN